MHIGIPVSQSKQALNHFAGQKFLMVQAGLLGMHLQCVPGSQTQALIWGLLLLLLKLFIWDAGSNYSKVEMRHKLVL